MSKQPLKEVNFNIPVTVFKQGEAFVAYTPALDISTYGSSKAEAQKSFEELVLTFFTSFEDHRELAQVLDSMGWTRQKMVWQPPKIEQTRITLPASLMAA